jgi:RimJ/RimL family protein N-acetyltransferase
MPTTLNGKFVDLISLSKEHFSSLRLLAREKRIWEHYIYDGSDPTKFDEILESALVEREKGSQFPFVILHKGDNRIIGSTRFLDIQFKHRKLEIGTTWIHPEYWGTEVNLECKLLLLTFCFEVLQALRVQLKTDENNERSRKAIVKIGGEFEGMRENNTRRNSACYSIVAQEWNEKKERLTLLMQGKCNASR